MTDPRIQQIWDLLGSPWAAFENKPLIETFWQALASGIQQVYRQTGEVQFSRTMAYMSGSFDDGPEVFPIVYSGVTGTTNVYPIASSSEQVTNGDFETNTSGWVLTGGAARSAMGHGTSVWSLYMPTRRPTTSYAVYDFGHDLSFRVNVTAYVYMSDPEDGQDSSNIHVELLDADNNIIESRTPIYSPAGWQKFSLYSTSQRVRKLRLVNHSKYVSAYFDKISVISNGLFAYSLPQLTYSIPTLTYRYIYNGVEYSGTYTEGVDYVLTAGMDSLVWIGAAPDADRRYPSTTKVFTATATHVYRINQALANMWAKIARLDIFKQWPYYESFGQDRYKHLRFLLWALVTYQMRAPSIHTLRNGYGVARGLPFAYASGLLTYTRTNNRYTASIGGDSFVFPSGVLPMASGYYDQFEVIASGVDLFDYVSNAGLINAYSTIYNRRNTIIYDIAPSLSGCLYSADYLSTYINRIMPEQISYLEI